MMPDKWLRFVYFLLGFFLALTALILFVRFSGVFNRGDPGPVVIRNHFIHDTIPPDGFRSTELSDTFATAKSVPWKRWDYSDSILRVQFEAPAFRNFRYWLALPQNVPSSTIPVSPRFCFSATLTTNFDHANLILGYKYFAFGLQYNYSRRSFAPLIGLHLRF